MISNITKKPKINSKPKIDTGIEPTGLEPDTNHRKEDYTEIPYLSQKKTYCNIC